MRQEYRSFSRPSQSAARARAGFSLIEALVVLVILVIGIFALVRLFPGGFLVIQRTGEQTIAQGLTAQMLEGQKGQLAVADSVLSAIPGLDNNLTIDDRVLNTRPDDLTDYTATTLPPGIPPTTDPYYVSNINIFRTILGETFRVPIFSPGTGRGFGPIYMLQQGPVYNRFGSSLDDPANPPDSIAVYGTTLERTLQNSVTTPESPDNTAILRNEGQYAIDYDHPNGPMIAFFPRRADAGANRPAFRQFRIVYDYYAAGSGSSPVTLRSILSGPGTLFTVPDVPATATGETPPPVWVPMFNTDGSSPNSLTPPAGLLALKRDSEDVSRKFRLVSLQTVITKDANGAESVNTPPFTDDPYEYGWFSPQEPNGVAGANGNVGVLIFNPRGTNSAIQTPGGPQPLTARVDYTIFDNHILREDRTLSGRGPYTVRLSVPNLLTTGDILSNNSAYNGLFRAYDNSGDGINTADLLVYDASTGEEVAMQKLDVNGAPIRRGAAFRIDARSGSVTFSDGLLGARPNRNLRFFYQAQKEWGMQIQKAHSRYVSANTLLDVTFRSYYVGGSQPGIGNPNRIYFPVCEAGKTVILGEYWRQNDTTPVRNEAQKINDNPALFESLTQTVDGQTRTLQMTWIDVGRPLSSDMTGRAVANVRGASITARVIWKDSERWRKLENETILTR